MTSDVADRTRMRYRPDIEGMRALAILLVVAAHAHVPGLEAGFIGVDVFFVISGYLISGLLIAERSQGRIDIATFYARRFRRLLPALLLVLLGTAFAATFLMPPQDRPFQALAGASASAWASNLYFAFGKLDYFAAGAESNVYLHTWSLGVEEQFYLVWPWLILLLWPRGGAKRRMLAGGMVVILLISFLACIWVTQVSARHAFYLMPFRAWQFAAGALVCMLGARISKEGTHPRWLAEASGIGGVTLILASLVLIRPASLYPGGWAALPTLGTTLLLLAASAGQSLATRALALAPMQAIGRVSYGWYLWHWPVLVLGTLQIPSSNLAQRLGLALAAFVLAALSYRLVERPVRQNAALVREPRRFILASLLVMVASVALFVRWGGVARTGANSAATTIDAAPSWSVPIIYSMGCDDWYHSDRLKPCVFGSQSAPRTAVVIGDSIGLQWFPAYARIFAAPQWRLIVLTKSSCPMVDSPIFNPRIMREFTECARWRDKALDYIAQARPDVVIMGSTHAAAFDQETWIEGTRRVLSRIASSSGAVYIIRSTPSLPFDGPGCVWSHGRGERAAAMDACSAPAANQRNEEVASWLEQAARDKKNVRMLDMNDVVCPNGTCQAMRNNVLAYRDTQHLTAEYVESLTDAMRAKLRDVLEASGD